MENALSRRSFLALAGGALVTARYGLASSSAHAALDHILLGCKTLDEGIAFVEEHTGVRAAVGGVHPGRGTWNALASLGKRSYLEIIAPDPKQQNPPWLPMLPTLSEPRLVGWVVQTDDIEAAAMMLRQAGIPCQKPRDGSRTRPDGRVLRWKKVDPVDQNNVLLPSFIQWGADSVHPSEDAPSGCSLVLFEARSPNPDDLRRKYQMLGVDVPISRGDKPGLRAKLEGANGVLDLVSY